MAGVRKKPRTKGGNFQGSFRNADGKRQHFTGTSSRSDTLLIARRLEDDHRQVRLGYRPASTSAERNMSKPFSDVKSEYLAWGDSQGGLGGREWSDVHSHKRRTHLKWWEERLGLQTVADLQGILPRVEKELRWLQSGKEKRTGKTVSNYSEALTSLCKWSITRGYLATDPLQGLTRFDATPCVKRRGMTEVEIRLLLDACPPYRSLLYETAILSGLRKKELGCLTVEHLDIEGGGLILDAAWTKNRKPGFQPLPLSLVERLSELASSGETNRLYAKFPARCDAKRTVPLNPLLWVQASLSRAFDQDLKAACIPKETSEGKLDFHALRLTFINLVLDSDVTAREAQALARHSTPNLTFNLYGRPRRDRMSEAVEEIASRVLSVTDCVPIAYRQSEGAEQKLATTMKTDSCASRTMVEFEGKSPPAATLRRSIDDRRPSRRHLPVRRPGFCPPARHPRR
jgi:integrase